MIDVMQHITSCYCDNDDEEEDIDINDDGDRYISIVDDKIDD